MKTQTKVTASKLIELGAVNQQKDILWTNNRSIGEIAQANGFQVNWVNGVRGYSAYIFIS